MAVSQAARLLQARMEQVREVWIWETTSYVGWVCLDWRSFFTNGMLSNTVTVTLQ